MRTSIIFGVALLQASIAACALEDGDVEESVEESEVTIPRVSNPPPQADLNNLPGDLRAVPAPLPPNLDEFVSDRQAAIALGKALYWDMQVGSDGIQACATCHFRAGADPRSKNALNPGFKHVPMADVNFKKGGPNYQLTKKDFPLTRLATPGVRGALHATKDNNDVVSSAGVAYLKGGLDPDGYNVDDTNTRRVEPRNTPSVINAVYNHRQFWDGRADNVFNGVNHVGSRDPNARVARATNPNTPALVQIALVNASLASQATVPVLADLEMSKTGRTMHEVGAFLLERRPLAKQKVHSKDSVLGSMSRYPKQGLKVDTYQEMIRDAFRSDWWNSNKLVRIAQNGTVTFVTGHDGNPNTIEMSMMNYNFAMFFGLALMMYEATLVSDNSPWDRFRRQHPSATDPALNPWTNTNPDHISRTALFGAMLFNDRTRGPTNIRCSNCHESNEMTDASVRRVTTATNGPVRNRDGNIIDKGFNNIGLRPTSDDLGVGASDAFGPLSHSRRLFPGAAPASFDGNVVDKGFAVQGAFKIPSLRNVALTAPYFHNGDMRTLREVMEFYSRGGNVAPIVTREGVTVEPLGLPALTEDEITALIAFLKSLTDERVVIRSAPFDGPQIFVPNGHKGNEHSVKDRNRDDFADDDLLEIAAVGRNGGAPLDGFLEGDFGPNGHDDHHDHDHGHGHGHGHGDCDD